MVTAQVAMQVKLSAVSLKNGFVCISACSQNTTESCKLKGMQNLHQIRHDFLYGSLSDVDGETSIVSYDLQQ